MKELVAFGRIELLDRQHEPLIAFLFEEFLQRNLLSAFFLCRLLEGPEHLIFNLQEYCDGFVMIKLPFVIAR